MVPSSAERVPAHTSKDVNRRIQHQTRSRIAYYADHPAEISHRLHELDHEWDIERAIEANASTLALAGVVLGVSSDRRWLALPAMVTAFLLQHAIQGWCPPVPVLRRFGFRTAREIEQERYALMALRGDFDGMGTGVARRDAVLQAVGLRKSVRGIARQRGADAAHQESFGADDRQSVRGSTN